MADAHHALTRFRLIALETKLRRALSGRGAFFDDCIPALSAVTVNRRFEGT
jgi:hypothetical protein